MQQVHQIHEHWLNNKNMTTQELNVYTVIASAASTYCLCCSYV